MPRRNEPSLIEVALHSRWPVAAAVSGLSAAVGYVIVPGLLASNAVFRPIGELLRTLSLFPIIGFGLIAVIKYLYEATGKTSAERPRERWSPAPPARPRTSSGYRGAFDAPVGPDRRDQDRTERPQERWTPARPARQHASSGYPGASDAPAGSRRSEPFTRTMPTEWSLALLQSIEWKRFEEVIAAYFRAKNFRCETIEYGPDGGVDGRLYFGDLPDPVGIIQCKAWDAKLVGVAPIRELLGVMTHQKVSRGYFCARGDFSKEAIAFAASAPIKLITGRDLLAAIASMPEQAQRDLLAVSTAGDYTTPTCPSCGIKLVARTIGGRAAWGCCNYPRCKSKIFRRSEQPARSA